MPHLNHLRRKQKCPQCEQATMRTSMLDCMVGRTAFLTDSCIECGYLQSYRTTAPRPAWQWIAASVAGLSALVVAVLWWVG